MPMPEQPNKLRYTAEVWLYSHIAKNDDPLVTSLDFFDVPSSSVRTFSTVHEADALFSTVKDAKCLLRLCVWKNDTKVELARSRLRVMERSRDLFLAGLTYGARGETQHYRVELNATLQPTGTITLLAYVECENFDTARDRLTFRPTGGKAPDKNR